MAGHSGGRGAWVVAAVVFALLVVLGGRYGFHRDELYFIEGGHHLDFAQPDNPITVPLLATGWHGLVGGNLILFRIVPALLAATTVIIAAGTSRRIGGSAVDQTVTAALMGGTSILLATGHLFSTTTFDLTLTSAVVLLLIRALQAPEQISRWLLLGVLAGVALEIKILPTLVLLSCLVGIVIMGPRAIIRSPGPWLAMVVAAVLAAPNLVWQTAHGWPMLEIAGNIAAGGSTSSSDRALVVPMHLLIAGPVAAVVLVLGLITPFRDRDLRGHRWVPVAYLSLLLVVVLTGGKPYYMAGLFAVTLALGTGPLVRFLAAGRTRRVVAALVAVALLVPTVVFALPVAPVGSPLFGAAVAVNPDQAETVGWPELIGSVERASREHDPGTTIILTRNYGEAGALSRHRRLHPSTPLPAVYSGHNAYGIWGPPPESARDAVVVGRFTDDQLAAWFGDCTLVETFSSPPGVDNEEDGIPIRSCRDRRQPWSVIWPEVVVLG